MKKNHHHHEDKSMMHDGDLLRKHQIFFTKTFQSTSSAAVNAIEIHLNKKQECCLDNFFCC
jgi:hypothetical protein